MLKYFIVLFVLVAIAIAGFFFLNAYIYDEKQGGAEDYKNATYVIGGQPVTLVDGSFVGSVSDNGSPRDIVQYFGNVAKGDLNGDEIPDLAFILTKSGGGSGTFYYVVAALQNSAGLYNGTNGMLLGDRIAPQTTEIRDGELIVNYADREQGEPMSARPSVGVSKYLRIVNGSLIEVEIGE